MKTLKTLTAAVLMVTVLVSSAFAADEPANQKLEMNYALKAYVDAVAHGKIKGLAEVLAQDVKFTTTRGENIITYTKSDVLKSLKSIENVDQNCETQTSIIESTPSLTVVKVVMKYSTFSKITYLNLANTTKGWKITNASSSFN